MTTPCHIVPPYILERVAASDDALAAAAERTLRHDHELRAERAASRRTTAAPAPSAPAPSAAGGRRSVHDAQNRTTLPGRLVRSEGDAASADVAVDEAYDGLGATRDFLAQVQQRDSIDGAGMGLVGSVHYGRKYLNAFWDGTQMVFGDGDDRLFGRFTASLDVIAHELGHGVTETTAALVYQGQPGALNEHVSDVIGALVTQWSKGQTAADADWLIGAQLLAPGVQGRGLRDMLDPGTAYDDPRLGKDPQPADMAHYVKTTDDYGGVHINSGIPNRAFALAARAAGGNAWQTVGPVWFDVLTGAQIQARCDFATFAKLTRAAASARHGAEGAVTLAVDAAWTTVGLPPTGTLVEVRRTGGLAGIVRRGAVLLDDLPGADADDLRTLLCRRESVPGHGPHADGFVYHLVCKELDADVSVPEHAIPEGVRGALEEAVG